MLGKTLKRAKTVAAVTFVVAMLAVSSMSVLMAHATAPQYDITGIWEWTFYYGGPWTHTMTITIFDSSTGQFSGTGVWNDDPISCTWNVTGTEDGNSIVFDILYTGTRDPGYTVHAEGTLSSSTSMSGWATTSAGQAGDWDATKIGNVPPGENVTVNPDPNVILTFALVTTGGDATVETSDSPPGDCPPLTGIIGPYFNIEVTAIFEGNVLVGIRYDDTGMTWCQEKRLRLYICTGEDPLGDVNHDGIVNLKDIFLITSALGTQPGDRRWKPDCDLNNDGHVNLKDLCIALKNFGQSFWDDITQYVDIENNIVYGDTDHFSIFGVR
jgi:hypothetical protein